MVWLHILLFQLTSKQCASEAVNYNSNYPTHTCVDFNTTDEIFPHFFKTSLDTSTEYRNFAFRFNL